MMADINAIVVNKTRQFVVVPMELVWNQLRLVCRHWVCGEVSKQRNQNGKGKHQAIEIAQGAEGIRQAFYRGKSGVGYIKGNL